MKYRDSSIAGETASRMHPELQNKPHRARRWFGGNKPPFFYKTPHSLNFTPLTAALIKLEKALSRAVMVNYV